MLLNHEFIQHQLMQLTPLVSNGNHLCFFQTARQMIVFSTLVLCSNSYKSLCNMYLSICNLIHKDLLWSWWAVLPTSHSETNTPSLSRRPEKAAAAAMPRTKRSIGRLPSAPLPSRGWTIRIFLRIEGQISRAPRFLGWRIKVSCKIFQKHIHWQHDLWMIDLTISRPQPQPGRQVWPSSWNWCFLL